LADKAFDAVERVIEPLLVKGITAVIARKSTRKAERPFDKEGHVTQSTTSPASGSNSGEIPRGRLSCSIKDRP
jgi:hypothetical protein